MDQIAFISNILGSKSKCILRIVVHTSAFVISPLISSLQTTDSVKLASLMFITLIAENAAYFCITAKSQLRLFKIGNPVRIIFKK